MVPDLPDDVLAFLKLIPRLGIAVSGGGDSLALLHAAHRACRIANIPLLAASVNHNLRTEAANECAFVGALCQDLDVHHTILVWEGRASTGNLQAAARDARYRLLSDWAMSHGITHVLLGHTADDQAETILMAIGRGAGVEGLSGMRSQTVLHGVTYLRPYLGVTRARLRDGLTEIGQKWVDDPSNDSETYQRVRLRKAQSALTDAGLDLRAFGQVADNMASVAMMLDNKTQNLRDREVILDRGDALVRQDLWKHLGFEVARRLMLSVMKSVSGQTVAPRRAEQREILRRLRQNRPATIAGCRVSMGWGMVRFAREFQAIRDLTTETDQVWDRRWRLDGPHAPNLHIGALGAGLVDCSDWRSIGLPEASLRASPAVWDGTTLVAAPVAGFKNGWTAQIVAEMSSSTSGH